MKFHQIVLKLFRPRPKPPQGPPVSVLDSIVNDRDWYHPKKQEHRKQIKAKP